LDSQHGELTLFTQRAKLVIYRCHREDTIFFRNANCLRTQRQLDNLRNPLLPPVEWDGVERMGIERS
jgi:hypothetical protein